LSITKAIAKWIALNDTDEGLEDVPINGGVYMQKPTHFGKTTQELSVFTSYNSSL